MFPKRGLWFKLVVLSLTLILIVPILGACSVTLPWSHKAGSLDYTDVLGTNEYHNLPSCPYYFYNPIDNRGYSNDRLNRLHDILHQFREAGWDSLYERDVFDCSNMSGFLHDYLEAQGFDVYILAAEITQRDWLTALGIEIEKLLGLSKGEKDYHAWVAIKIFDDGRYVAVESTTPIETWYPPAYKYQAVYSDRPQDSEYEYEGLPQVAAVMQQLGM